MERVDKVPAAVLRVVTKRNAPKKAKIVSNKPKKYRKANAYSDKQFKSDKTFVYYNATVLASAATMVLFETDEVPEIIVD